MARLALTTVSSSRTTMSPALTMSPSLHAHLADHAAGRVLNFLDVESTTTEPGAISAPEICAVEAQPPNPPASTSISDRPDDQMRAGSSGARPFSSAVMIFSRLLRRTRS